VRQSRKTGGAAPAAPPLALRAATILVKACGALSTLTILAAFALTIYAVVMRYLVNRPLLWSEDVTGWMLVALVMLGAAEAYRRGDHIAIDLATGGFTGRAARWAATWADLAVLTLAAVLFLSTWEAVTFARDFGAYTSGSVEIPAWIPQAPMLLGAATLGLVAVSRIAARTLGRSNA